MVEEKAVVVSVEGPVAWVETQRTSSCGACSANKGCGTGTIARYLSARSARVRALNRAAARVGDVVILGLDESALLRGAILLYAMPLMLFFGLAVVAELFARHLSMDSEPFAVIGGVTGLLTAYWWLRSEKRRIANDPRYQPVILRAVDM
jgi:sigma-E factor negative regulatory protein RseC